MWKSKNEKQDTETLDAQELLREPVATKDRVVDLQLDLVTQGPYQPRLKPLKRSDVSDLIESISSNGQTAPIVVESATGEDEGKYWVHAGNRRCAALRFLGREWVKAIIRYDLDERSARQLAIADNLGREDLTAFEQANALRDYCDAFDLSIEAGAEELGVARRTGYRLKTILSAPEPLQLIIRDRAISARAAELLAKVAVKRPKRAVRLAEKFADGKANMKALEDEARTGRGRARPTTAEAKDVQLKADRNRIALKLNLALEERTAEQVDRVVAAVGTVLRYLGVPKVEAAPEPENTKGREVA